MPSTGPNNPSTVVSDSSSGVRDWSNPSNAATSNDSRASVTLTGLTGSGPQSYYLKATGFGFAIPAGATIDGIVAQVEGHRGSAFANSPTLTIVKAGAIVGDPKTLTGFDSATDQTRSGGGASDLWGQSWTPADVNSSDFGVAFQITCTAFDSTDGRVINIDAMSITVYYTEPTGNHPHHRRPRRVRNLLRM